MLLSKRVIVIGGGLAGTLAAILLERAGCDVSLIDALRIYPNEFRAEQVISEDHLKKLDLLEAVVGSAIAVGRARAYRLFWRWGWLAKTDTGPHYGIRYETMVNGARRHLPANVDFINERVDSVETSPDVQRVTLRSGRVLESRLIVLATGLQSHLLAQLDMTRKMLSKEHSVAIGFDVSVECIDRFRTSVLTIYGNNWLGGEKHGSINYVTFFLIGDTLRGNLFSNGRCNSAWTRRFKLAPIETLLETVPWLEKQTGKILAIDNIRVRPADVAILQNHLQPGVVCVGDTYISPCPATGTGIPRLLQDVDLLGTEYVAKWLEGPGMGVEKIREFYEDPRKKECDDAALCDAMWHRGSTNGTGMKWAVRRARAAAQEQWRRGFSWLRALAPGRSSR